MPVCFLDSSALVKRYRLEAGSERVRDLIESAEAVAVARLAHIEVSSAIVRRGRGGAAEQKEISDALAILDRDVSDSFDVVELDAPIMARATTLARMHALRAADAIQLACALLAHSDAGPQDFFIVTSDQELNAAASTEGLDVLDPTAS